MPRAIIERIPDRYSAPSLILVKHRLDRALSHVCTCDPLVHKPQVCINKQIQFVQKLHPLLQLRDDLILHAQNRDFFSDSYTFLMEIGRKTSQVLVYLTLAGCRSTSLWYPIRRFGVRVKCKPPPVGAVVDALSDQVFTQAPYASNGKRDTLNSNDNIYHSLLLLTVTKTNQGYATVFPIGLDLSTIGTGQSSGTGGPGGPPPNGPGGPLPNRTAGPSGAPAQTSTAQSSR